MSAIDDLRTAVEGVADEVIWAWEAGFQDGLKAVLEDFCSRSNNTGQKSWSFDSIVAIVQSHRRPHPEER